MSEPGRPLQYIGLLITLEGLSVPAADQLLILVFIVALFSCNPPSSLIRDLSGDFANNFDSCRCWRTLQVNSPEDLLNINDCLSDGENLLEE